MSLIEIEVIEGRSFGLEQLSSDRTRMSSQLRLHLPNDSRIHTVRGLLSEIMSQYDRIGELVMDPKTQRIKGNAVILHNGRNIDLLQGLDTPIEVGDRLVLLPFVDGG